MLASNAAYRLSINRVSDNAGGVKQFRAHNCDALRLGRHFALIEKVPYPTKARLVIPAGQNIGPTHASLRSLTAIMITSSDSPYMGAGCPINYSMCACTPSRFPGCPACEPKLLQLLVIPLLAPHAVQANRQSARHRHFRGFPSAPKHQVKVLAAPFRNTAHRDLRRFHQQKAQHRTALLRDVTQPPAVSAGFL